MACPYARCPQASADRSAEPRRLVEAVRRSRGETRSELL
jgi:hypothetical protein